MQQDKNIRKCQVKKPARKWRRETGEKKKKIKNIVYGFRTKRGIRTAWLNVSTERPPASIYHCVGVGRDGKRGREGGREGERTNATVV